MNEKPLIITEGKTDPLYIKSALHKMYKNYPSLIETKGDKFRYKFKFFNRSDKLCYFFYLSKTGADTLKNIISLYAGNDWFKKCAKIIDKYNIVPKKPVIILLDNEQKSTDKPLCKILNYIKNIKKIAFDDDKRKFFSTNCYIKLFENLNLYIATIPLPKEMKECEIENLLDENTLKTKIHGKTFNPKIEKCNEDYYSKNVLANYVYKNRHYINLDGFGGLLNILNKIIE